MIPFPPFLGFNSYYRKTNNIPYKPYAPKAQCDNKNNYGTSYNSVNNCKSNSLHYNNNANSNSSSFYNSTNSQGRIQNNYNFNNNEILGECSFNSSDKKQNSKNEYEPIFTIFGINLYFDDILILALLLFLNTEDVKDNYLYIILIMLLFN